MGRALRDNEVAFARVVAEAEGIRNSNRYLR